MTSLLRPKNLAAAVAIAGLSFLVAKQYGWLEINRNHQAQAGKPTVVDTFIDERPEIKSLTQPVFFVPQTQLALLADKLDRSKPSGDPFAPIQIHVPEPPAPEPLPELPPIENLLSGSPELDIPDGYEAMLEAELELANLQLEPELPDPPKPEPQPEPEPEVREPEVTILYPKAPIVPEPPSFTYVGFMKLGSKPIAMISYQGKSMRLKPKQNLSDGWYLYRAQPKQLILKHKGSGQERVVFRR